MAETKIPAKSRGTRASALKSTAPRRTEKSERALPTIVVSKYAVGDEVSHPMFGHGAVTGIDANKLTIDFPENVTKQIVDDYVKLRNP
jgi:hypothetical protein